MTANELREAFLEGCPVTYRIDSMPGVLFRAEKIEEIVYKKIRGAVRVSANVIDSSGCMISVPHIVVEKEKE